MTVVDRLLAVEAKRDFPIPWHSFANKIISWIFLKVVVYDG